LGRWDLYSPVFFSGFIAIGGHSPSETERIPREDNVKPNQERSGASGLAPPSSRTVAPIAGMRANYNLEPGARIYETLDASGPLLRIDGTDTFAWRIVGGVWEHMGDARGVFTDDVLNVSNPNATIFFSPDEAITHGPGCSPIEMSSGTLIGRASRLESRKFNCVDISTSDEERMSILHSTSPSQCRRKAVRFAHLAMGFGDLFVWPMLNPR
jgi:hypothetical protein